MSQAPSSCTTRRRWRGRSSKSMHTIFCQCRRTTRRRRTEPSPTDRSLPRARGCGRWCRHCARCAPRGRRSGPPAPSRARGRRCSRARTRSWSRRTSSARRTPCTGRRAGPSSKSSFARAPSRRRCRRRRVSSVRSACCVHGYPCSFPVGCRQCTSRYRPGACRGPRRERADGRGGEWYRHSRSRRDVAAADRGGGRRAAGAGAGRRAFVAPPAPRLRSAGPPRRSGAAPAPAGAPERRGFFAAVLEKFVVRTEVEAMLLAWTVETCALTAADAAARGDLALYASTLWAARPMGYAFGLGVAVVLDAQQRDRQREDDEGKSRNHERSALEEARRRADAARLEAEPRSRRGGRAAEGAHRAQDARGRRDCGRGCGAAAGRRAPDRARPGARRVGRATDSADARGAADPVARRRSAPRARRHQRVAGPRRKRGVAARSARRTRAHRRGRGRSAAVGVARRVAAPDPRGRVVRRRPLGFAAPEIPTPSPRPPAPTRRAAPNLPPGVVANSPMGVEAMLATPDVVLIVDGYNIAHRAWPHATAVYDAGATSIAATAFPPARLRVGW